MCNIMNSSNIFWIGRLQLRRNDEILYLWSCFLIYYLKKNKGTFVTKRRYFRIPHLNWNVGYDDDVGIIMEWDWIWLPIFSNLRPSCQVLQAPYHQVHKKIGDAGIHLFFFSFACTTHVSGTKNQLDITMWHKKLKKKKTLSTIFHLCTVIKKNNTCILSYITYTEHSKDVW